MFQIFHFLGALLVGECIGICVMPGSGLGPLTQAQWGEWFSCISICLGASPEDTGSRSHSRLTILLETIDN